MSEKHFACTACGRCCYGSLPITISEALKWAHVFPLAMSIVPVRPGTRGHTIVSTIGAPLKVSKGKDLSLLLMPTSFLPPMMPCPQLSDETLCAIHGDKPLRCRTMPFYPYKDEEAQADMLVPKPGWQCATGQDAPVVYRERKVLDRSDFDAERRVLIEEGPSLRRFMASVVAHNPALRDQIIGASRSVSGRVIVSFVSYLRYERRLDPSDYAQRQRPVLREWLQRTEGDTRHAEFHEFYQRSLRELDRYGA